MYHLYDAVMILGSSFAVGAAKFSLDALLRDLSLQLLGNIFQEP